MFSLIEFHSRTSSLSLKLVICAGLWIAAGQGIGTWTAGASQINWRSPIASTNVTSDGSSPMDSTYEFQLGSFADGFMPTAENLSDWADHWLVQDMTAYNGTTRFFSSTILLETNQSPFAIGTSGYIWGRNHLDGSDDEWILMRSVRWRWPVANNGVAFPVEWEIDEATIAILGEVNGADFLMKSADVGTDTGNAADEWLAAHFTEAQLADPEVSDWTADPDKDGSQNLLEFTTGGDPLLIDHQISTPQWSRTLTNTSSYTLSLNVTDAARDLVSINMQFATSLKAWLPLPAAPIAGDGNVSFSVAPGNAMLYYRVFVDFLEPQ